VPCAAATERPPAPPQERKQASKLGAPPRDAGGAPSAKALEKLAAMSMKDRADDLAMANSRDVVLS
jgi:hypothetical protein